jgi:hypothetical protein
MAKPSKFAHVVYVSSMKVSQMMMNARALRVSILLLTFCMPQSYVARAQSDGVTAIRCGRLLNPR